MRVIVVGAGAVGSVLGGLLAQAGHDVALLGRAWHLDVVDARGLEIDGLWGAHRVPAKPAGTRWACGLQTARCTQELPADLPPDWLFVCVKATQTGSAALILPALLGPDTLVCAFQNGLGNDEVLAGVMTPARLALGRVIFGAELASPGHVRVTVCADDVLIGAPDASVASARLDALAEALRRAGIPTRTTPRIMTALWAKVLYNCALNPLATLLEVPYGRLPQHQIARRLIERVVEEAYAVAAARGMTLEPATPGAYRRQLFERLIPDTAAHYPSMLQDLRRGRPTEIGALNGAIARLGQETGVPTTANALLTRLIRARERFIGVEER